MWVVLFCSSYKLYPFLLSLTHPLTLFALFCTVFIFALRLITSPNIVLNISTIYSMQYWMQTLCATSNTHAFFKSNNNKYWFLVVTVHLVNKICYPMQTSYKFNLLFLYIMSFNISCECINGFDTAVTLGICRCCTFYVLLKLFHNSTHKIDRMVGTPNQQTFLIGTDSNETNFVDQK